MPKGKTQKPDFVKQGETKPAPVEDQPSTVDQGKDFVKAGEK